MKALPHEQPAEKQQRTSSKRSKPAPKSVRFTRNKFDKLHPDRLEIKKLANRIYHFASIDTTRDSEVLDLIADTKAKLIKLHLARKSITHKKQKRRN